MTSKERALALTLSIALAAPFSLAAREFTDAKGRKIEADLVAHAGESVIISRGGKEFTIKINSLSLDDQAYIAQWIGENPDAMRFKFGYFIDLEEGRQQTRKIDYDERLKVIPKTYSLSISNKSPGPLDGATIKCLVLVEDFVDTRDNRFRSLATSAPPRNGRVQRILATVPVEKVQPQGRVDIDMNFAIHYYVDRDGGRVDQAVKDRVLGVWIRVFRGGKMIAERVDAEIDKKMATVEWSETGAEKNEPKVEVK